MTDPATRIRAIVGDRLKCGEPLAGYTTLRVGGPADYLVVANRRGEVVDLVETARDLGLAWCVIGRGSNLLVADRGVRGLVVRNASDQACVDDRRVRADAGVSCAQLASRTARLGLTGFEFAVAIPGTVGGAIVQNAGAHGREMVDVVRAVESIGPDGRVETVPVEQLQLAYRTSCFKRPPRDRAVLGAEIELRRSTRDEALALIDEIRTWRAASQPAEPSAGSIFANPPGDYAGRLIEVAGLKGRQIGQAQISPRHANFIVNLGGARAADVAGLIDLARATVHARFGVCLEQEVEPIGDW
jgi:UDP-N-acetylmuramate dehydrogenase